MINNIKRDVVTSKNILEGSDKKKGLAWGQSNKPAQGPGLKSNDTAPQERKLNFLLDF